MVVVQVAEARISPNLTKVSKPNNQNLRKGSNSYGLPKELRNPLVTLNLPRMRQLLPHLQSLLLSTSGTSQHRPSLQPLLPAAVCLAF